MATRAELRRVADKFGEWVNEQDAEWIAVTFICRKRLRRSQITEIELVNSGLLSDRFAGSSCSVNAVKAAVTATVKHLDYKFIKCKLRKRGVKLRRVLFQGGDRDAGVWNHVHGLIELPKDTSFENFKGYLNLIFRRKLEEYYGYTWVETSVWCERHKGDCSKYIKYCLRQEGKELTVPIDFDKVLGTQLVLSPMPA